MLLKNKWYILFLILLLIIPSLILGLCHLKWWYYYIGYFLGIVIHALILVQNKSLLGKIEADPKHEFYSPRKTTILWYFLRWILIIGVFILVIFLSGIQYDKNEIFSIVIMLSAFILVKIMFIVYLKIKKVGDTK